LNAYRSKLYNIGGSVQEIELGLEQAFNYVHSGEVDVVLSKVLSSELADSWWADHESLKMNDHEYHGGITTSGMTLGKLQRASEDEYPARFDEYFSSAITVNAGLKTTQYYHFFEKELGTQTLFLDSGEEMLIASQREYPPSNEEQFSFAPHSDSISFSRARVSWPIQEKYKQTASFITIKNATNDAGFVIWDYIPESRAELDKFYSIYNEDPDKGMAFLNRHLSMEIHPEEGELCIFNCRKMHGIQTCNTLRRTIGSFFIRKDNGWKIFD
jgi:hypothetical protein